MSELPLRIKDGLRMPRPAVRVEIVWSNIRARRDRKRPTLLQLTGFATACALLMLALRVGVPSRAGSPERSGSPQLQALATGTVPAPAGPLRLQDGSPIPALRATTQPLQLTLSDGSRLTLSANTELLPRDATNARMDFALLHGCVLLDVVPHGPRRWSVDAGEVQVSVLGTRFRVERDASGVVVHVERGVVRVAGALVPHGAAELTADQELRVPAVIDGSRAAAKSGATRSPAQTFEGELARATSAAQLLALADRARIAGQPQSAALALERLLEHHAEDPSAALAALTLGRICLDQLQAPARAAQALELATRLGLPQALAEEGAARLVEAHAKAGQTALARTAAARYRAQYPAGQRSADVATWAKTQ